MLTQHEPDPDFERALERDLQSSLRRQQRWHANGQARRPVSRKWRWSGLAALLALAVSAGAFSMYAAIRSEDRSQRDLIVAGLETKLRLQRLRCEVPAEALAEAEALVEAGVVSSAELDERRNDLQLAEFTLRRIEIDLSESMLSGREPDDRLSAPLVDGADFVSKRLQLDRQAAVMNLENARRGAQRLERHVGMSTVSAHEADAAREEVLLAEQEVKRVDDRLALRDAFIQGEMGRLEVEHRGMLLDAEYRSREAVAKRDRAARELDRLQALADADYVSRSELRRAQLAVAEREAQQRLADLERQLIEARLEAARRQR